MMTDRFGKPRMRTGINRQVVVLNSSVEFNWYTDSDWFERAQQDGPCPLEQSWNYGEAIASISLNYAYRAVVEIDGRVAGTLQVAERKLPGGLGLTRLTRGPVVALPSDQRNVFHAVRRGWPRRKGNLLFWMPDVAEDAAPGLLRPLHKRPMTTGYATAWLDLSPDIDTLRGGLRGNWRGALAKAEAAAPAVHFSRTPEDIDEFVTGYLRDKRETGYKGPPERLVRALTDSFGDDLLLVRVADAHDTLAASLFLRHGRSATYFLSWTTPGGRHCNAAHLLMWRAIEELRRSGVSWIDLGGLDARAPGVARFKLGLGAAPTVNSGTWL